MLEAVDIVLVRVMPAFSQPNLNHGVFKYLCFNFT